VITVSFKSNPDNFKKEESGLKSNTVREIEMGDSRFDMLSDFPQLNMKIEIINSATGKKFIRLISDVTWFNNYVIISWKGVEEK